jgi:hypothetical protein
MSEDENIVKVHAQSDDETTVINSTATGMVKVQAQVDGAFSGVHNANAAPIKVEIARSPTEQTERERFSTRHKIVLGTILGLLGLSIILLFTVHGGIHTGFAIADTDAGTAGTASDSCEAGQTYYDINWTPHSSYPSYSWDISVDYLCCEADEIVFYPWLSQPICFVVGNKGSASFSVDYVSRFPDKFECNPTLETNVGTGSEWSSLIDVVSSDISCPNNMVCQWRNSSYDVLYDSSTSNSLEFNGAKYGGYGTYFDPYVYVALTPDGELAVEGIENYNTDFSYSNTNGGYSFDAMSQYVGDNGTQYVQLGYLPDVGTVCNDDIHNNLTSASINLPYLFVTNEGLWIAGRAYTDNDESIQSETIEMSAVNANTWNVMPILQYNTTLTMSRQKHVAELYTMQGVAEHTSMASFSRASVQLLAHVAPADIMFQIYTAAADEVRHAQICFSLAHQFGGTVVPSVFPFPNESLSTVVSASELALSTLKEGVLGETTAVVRLVCRSNIPKLANSLHTTLLDIANDEARHAALAWRTVGFFLYEHPDRMDVRVSIEEWILDKDDKFTARNPENLRLDELYTVDPLNIGQFGLLPDDIMLKINEMVSEQFIFKWMQLMLEFESFEEFQNACAHEAAEHTDTDRKTKQTHLSTSEIIVSDGIQLVLNSIIYWKLHN